jgi:hypothetical protein
MAIGALVPREIRLQMLVIRREFPSSSQHLAPDHIGAQLSPPTKLLPLTFDPDAKKENIVQYGHNGTVSMEKIVHTDPDCL